MKYVATLLLFVLATTLGAQNFLRSFGGFNNEEALAIGMDDANRIYTAGYFNSTFSFAGISQSTNGISDIFVARSEANGASDWMFTGGSAGPDRANALAVSDNNQTAVTGYFSHNADFGGQILASNNTSQDFFVLLLDSDGEMLWVRNFGGELGDTGFGIDFDTNGNILVTGQFRGTIDFDGTVFTSTTLPDGTALSFDTFVLKLSPDGDIMWAKHGQNAGESRGLDISSDNEGNVLVCGQFSDTLTFDQTHNNDILNAAFVVKFDEDGNELWFRRFTSSQTIAYALATDSQNEIYVTGDNIGPMLFFSPDGNQYFATDYTYNLFLARFSADGDLQWLTNNGSENPVSSKAIALDDSDSPYIAGTFNCLFDEYAEPLGTGVFYSLGWRDVFISKFDTAGERLWSRNMASNGDALCSAIAIKQSNLPVIAGGFADHFVVTNANTFENYPANIPLSTVNGSYCDDPEYGQLRGVESEGNKDIFISSPINLDREPLDYFYRSGSDCIRDYREICIGDCLDSLTYCGIDSISLNQFIPLGLLPASDVEWIPPPGVSAEPFEIPETGLYILQYERQDGCFNFTDSLYATVHPVPIPTISDNLGINENSPPLAFDIVVCLPDTAILTGGNFSENDNYWWTPDGTIPQFENDSTVYVHNQSGTWNFHIENEFGCSDYNQVHISYASQADTLPLEIIFPNLQEPVDTVFICANELFAGALSSIDGDQGALNILSQNSDIYWALFPTETGIVSFSSNSINVSVSATESGYYTLVGVVDGLCGDNIMYIEREIYIYIYPQADTSVEIIGPSQLCPGEMAVLSASGGSNHSWVGPDFQLIDPASISISQEGTYILSSTVVNEFGCSSMAFDQHTVSFSPAPSISMFPANGIVCPGDSVLLTAQPGLNYNWIGPSGQLVGNTQNIWVDIPGFYHCIVTDFFNCAQESNFLEVKEYASPYLVALPGSDLCLADEILVEAIVDPSAEVYWQPPLDVYQNEVLLTEPGTYYASVTLCGITTSLEFVLNQTEVDAWIDFDGPSTVCNDSTVVLMGNPGMNAYTWLPGGETTQNLIVNEPGEYTLLTYDEEGCMGESESVVITGASEVLINSPESIHLCESDSLELTVDGDFNHYEWQPGGDTLPTLWIFEPGTYQVFGTDDQGCIGESDPIEILPGDIPEIPNYQLSVLCEGDNLVLNIDTDLDVYWVNDDETMVSNPFIIDNLDNDTTLYFYVLSDHGCANSDSIFVSPIPTDYQPIITSNTEVCSGDTLIMNTQSINSAIYNWTINGETLSTNSQLEIWGSYTEGTTIEVALQVTIEPCAEGTDTFIVEVLPVPQTPEILGDLNVCTGDEINLFTTFPDSVNGWWTWNENELWGDSLSLNHDSDSVLVSLTPIFDGCSGIPAQEWIQWHPYPLADSVITNQPVCEGELLALEVYSNEGDVIIHSPWGPSFPGGSMQLASSEPDYSGIYELQVFSDFCESTDEIELLVHPVPVVNLGTDSTWCTGNVASFYIEGYPSVIWNNELEQPGYQTNSSELVAVEVANSFGCTVVDSLWVVFENCDGEIPNVFTPNGDGVNDNFYFNPYNYESYQCSIYNRWGQLICEISNIDYWDGKHCSSDKECPGGTYFYILEYRTLNSIEGNKAGYVQLLR